MAYGLDYPPSIVDTLPVVSPDTGLSTASNTNMMDSGTGSSSSATIPLDSLQPDQPKDTQDSNPVRLISPSLFASFHLDHLVSHPADHVLFPFLHGLEGDNDAQNTFFANANLVAKTTANMEGTPISYTGSHHVVNVTLPNIAQNQGQHQQAGAKTVDLSHSPFTSASQSSKIHQLLRPKVPQYRGLVWVVCEDDLKDDKITLSVLRRKPLPSSSAPADSPEAQGEAILFEDSDDDAMLTSSDDDDFDDDDSSTSDTESSSFEGNEDFEDEEDPLREGSVDHFVAASEYGLSPASISQQDEQRGILSSVGDDPSSLGKPLSKQEMDSMPYMHPVVMPHHPHHQHSSQFASLPALDTSNITISASVSSSGSEADAVFTTTTPATGTTAATSLSASPTSAAPNSGGSYEHPKIIELHEATRLHPNSIEQEDQRKDEGRQEHVNLALLNDEMNGNAKPRTRIPKHKRKGKRQTDPAAPPLLTCTFRPKELLKKRKSKRSDDLSTHGQDQKEAKKKTEWEFVPTRVPDGISLRNFGIQVPIYATLSDVVVYSPKGVTPNAMALAERFRQAIRRKREERITALRGIVYSQVHANTQTYKKSDGAQTVKVQHHHVTTEDLVSAAHGEGSKAGGEVGHAEQDEDLETRLLEAAERYLLQCVDEELLDYNVFVLDANEEEMRKKIGHLMMHSCGSGVPGVEKPLSKGGLSSTPLGSITGAHTIATDGGVAEEERLDANRTASSKSNSDLDTGLIVGDIDIDVDSGIDQDGDVNMMDSSVPNSPQTTEEDTSSDISDSEPYPNTVDFALREREEMRDLTKASEIISLFPSTGSASNTPTKASFLKGGLYDSPQSATPLNAGFAQPPHLQHLSNLIPSSPRPAYQSAPSSLTNTPPEFTYNHPDPSVDISSPSSFHDPRVGQVFLGNSSDVPLAPEPPSNASQESARNRLEDINADEMAEDDPFNPTVTNNPAKGFGYDICIECHELAPFPTASHLRAAEEHLLTLERVWRDRVVRKEMERMHNDSQSELEGNHHLEGGPHVETKTLQIPPRPPPHANAIIHLPFPSSPANTQATLAHIIPILRFIERWIRPVPDVHVDVQVEITPVPEPVPPSVEEMSDDSSSTMGNMNGVRRWSNSVVSSILPSVFGGSNTTPTPPSAALPSPSPPPSSFRSRSNTTPAPTSLVNPFYQHQQPSAHPHHQHSSSYSQHPRHQQSAQPPRVVPTRPLKILIYSADGYTESSLPSLCLLMSVKGLSLPEAYLELQVAKRRSFFVYQHDLGILRRVESRLREERERERERIREAERQRELREVQIAAQRERERAERERNERDRDSNAMSGNGNGKRSLGSSFFRGLGMGVTASSSMPSVTPAAVRALPDASSSGERRQKVGRPAAKSVSFAHAPVLQLPPSTLNNAVKVSPLVTPGAEPASHSPGLPEDQAKIEHPSTMPPTTVLPQHGKPPSLEFPPQGEGRLRHAATISGGHSKVQASSVPVVGRPRANTSPWLPSATGGDHQSWFNDPRFDGSFPSRVLPFLYLGNLSHASNVYMLHALGITHVVSVGECALLPPPFHMQVLQGNNGGNNYQSRYRHSNSNGSGHGSLWTEEREGRIKVLDIKGVCDDGIDTLEPQLEPICDWIDKARAEGGQVLVHCRVGVSRSATVTIAYVMKYLSLPLVDAYLIVRSRRLSVLIQPNMRLLYNLCGWEVKLAKERAGVTSKAIQNLELSDEDREKKRKKEEKRLRKELARTLPWPYLSKEVHALNEKYLH